MVEVVHLVQQKQGVYTLVHFFYSHFIFSFVIYVEGSEEPNPSSNRGPFIALCIIFISALIAMTFVYTSFPELRP
jgi:hypothetical protein